MVGGSGKTSESADQTWLQPAAERAGLVRLHAGQFRFRHPLTRSAVVSISSSEERRHSHQVLAKQLTGQPERGAWHLAEAAVAPDEEVAALLEPLVGGEDCGRNSATVSDRVAVGSGPVADDGRVGPG
jgi:hypothetical protein